MLYRSYIYELCISSMDVRSIKQSYIFLVYILSTIHKIAHFNMEYYLRWEDIYYLYILYIYYII